MGGGCTSTLAELDQANPGVTTHEPQYILNPQSPTRQRSTENQLHDTTSRLLAPRDELGDDGMLLVVLMRSWKRVADRLGRDAVDVASHVFYGIGQVVAGGAEVETNPLLVWFR